MRLFEILITIFTLPCLISGIFLKRERRSWRLLPTVIILLLLILHLIFEGWRWQMFPVYGVIVILSLIFTISAFTKPLKVPKKKIQKILRIAFTVLGFLVASLAVAATLYLATTFPVMKLPEPSGPYDVGRTNLVFQDCSREETFTEDPDDCREVAAQVWYPAAIVGNEKKSIYLTKEEAISLSQGLLNQGESLPNFLVTYISLVKTHSYENAPINQEGNPYPVLLFNHGYNAWSTGYTVFHEELASHGYVVVGVTHAYECTWFSMPDGTMKTFPQTAEVDRHNADAFMKGEQIKWQITTSSDVEEMEKGYRALQENSPNLYESVNIWAEDNSFVIDQLGLLNQEGALFNGSLDLDRIGVYGHSFGGATAGQVSLTDPRIKAGVNMDGFQYGDLVDQPLSTPFMFINAEHASENRPDPDTTGIYKLFYARAENDVFILFLKGTEHNNFADMVLNGKQLSGRGASLAPLRGLRITNDYLLAFFGEYLKGEPSRLLETPPEDYPEVVLHARRP